MVCTQVRIDQVLMGPARVANVICERTAMIWPGKSVEVGLPYQMHQNRDSGQLSSFVPARADSVQR